MFGSKINHSDLQKLEEENKNLTHKIEKFQSENLELKNKITSVGGKIKFPFGKIKLP